MSSINAVLRDQGVAGTEDYSFGAHARHWSELKGLALSLQFNRRSPLSDEDFLALHQLIGMGPLSLDASPLEREARVEALLEARAMLAASYGFDAANVGDDGGTGGW